jgi:hypothetical protein
MSSAELEFLEAAGQESASLPASYEAQERNELVVLIG